MFALQVVLVDRWIGNKLLHTVCTHMEGFMKFHSFFVRQKQRQILNSSGPEEHMYTTVDDIL